MSMTTSAILKACTSHAGHLEALCRSERLLTPRILPCWRAGQENFIAKTYDYVMSDMALTFAQYKACNRCSCNWPCPFCSACLHE